MNSWLTSIYEDLSITWPDAVDFLVLKMDTTSYTWRITFSYFVQFVSFVYCVLLIYYICRFIYKLLVRRKERL